MTGETENALNIFLTAKERFKDPKVLYIYGSNIYKCLKNYDRAFECWNNAFEIDSSYTHALHEIAHCYEELGHYKNVYETYLRTSNGTKQAGI